MGDHEKAKRYYADAYFAPIPHCEKVRHYYDYADAHFVPMPRVESRNGLERLYHQIKREDTTDKFRKSHRKMKSHRTRYIQQIPSETQRFGCEVSGTLRV